MSAAGGTPQESTDLARMRYSSTSGSAASTIGIMDPLMVHQYPICYAFRLDPATEAALEQIARHTLQSKASIMRRYVQEGVRRNHEVNP